MRQHLPSMVSSDGVARGAQMTSGVSCDNTGPQPNTCPCEFADTCAEIIAEIRSPVARMRYLCLARVNGPRAYPLEFELIDEASVRARRAKRDAAITAMNVQDPQTHAVMGEAIWPYSEKNGNR